MKIVASTKLTRAQRAMTESRSYGQTSNTVFEEAETKPVESEGKKTLLVICSSDKGLCGGVHSGLTRATRRFMNENSGDYELVVLGEKCKAQLSRSNAKNMVLSFAGVGRDVPTFADAQAIADQISLLPNDYTSIKIMYNKFINAQSYEATMVEAYSEEAFAASRESLDTHFFISSMHNANPTQPTSPLTRSMKRSSRTCVNMPWPTACTGRWPRATPASSPPAATPWTTPPRTPAT